MKTITLLAVIAILAGAVTMGIGPTVVASVIAQTDNATMGAGNMTGGNMTASNSTAGESGQVSGRIH